MRRLQKSEISSQEEGEKVISHDLREDDVLLGKILSREVRF